jgi:hypothetical protein
MIQLSPSPVVHLELHTHAEAARPACLVAAGDAAPAPSTHRLRDEAGAVVGGVSGFAERRISGRAAEASRIVSVVHQRARRRAPKGEEMGRASACSFNSRVCGWRLEQVAGGDRSYLAFDLGGGLDSAGWRSVVGVPEGGEIAFWQSKTRTDGR